MTRRGLMTAGIFGAVALGAAALAGAASYFGVLKDDDDDEDEGRESIERNKKNEPLQSAPTPQPQNGAPQ